MQELIFQYQNANQSYQTVIDNFVIRNKEFERIINDLKITGIEDSYQHVVFVGRRGSGKSTLLRRIQAEIVCNADLNQNYVAVNLSEEQTGIYKLFDLWDYVIRDLNTQKFGIEEVNFRAYKNDLVAYNRILHSQIIEALRKANKRLVLLVDNFDRVLKNADEDTAFLREVLMNYKEIRIIGGSTVMSEHFWKYDKPFYQFFTIKRLEALSLKDIEALLFHWAEISGVDEIKNIINKYPGKIQSIRMLTDGSPRTMLLFVDMLLNRTEQNGYHYLQNIVDKATPIYQERLGTLSPAQAKVLTELAFFWEAATVEQLIQPCKMEGKTISALMSQLVSLRYVEKIDSDTKNKLYRLEERFFNLWINMTQGGPQQRHEAKALTAFLEIWYDQTELQGLAKDFYASLRTRNIKPDYVESMSHALLKSKVLDTSLKQDLILDITKYTSNIPNQIIKEAFGDFDSAITKAFETENYEKVINILELSDIEDGKRNFGLGLANQNLKHYDLAEKYYIEAIEKGNNDAIYNLANLYGYQGKTDLAEKYYIEAIEKGNNDAIYNLANLYGYQGKTDLAEKYYIEAIEKGVIDAINNLAILYKNQGNTDLAEKYYVEAIERGNIDAIYNLANLYKNQGNTDLAEKYYLKAIEKGNIDAIVNLAILYKNQGNTDLAEKYYLEAIEKGNIDAIYNLGNLYKNQGNTDLAEKYYVEAIEKGNMKAINNLAILYKNQGKTDLAEKYYNKAIEKGNNDAINNLAILYDDQGKTDLAQKYYIEAIEKGDMKAIYNLAIFYNNQGNTDLAEKFYKVAIEKGIMNAINNLAILYKNQGKTDLAQKYFIKAIEKGHIDAINNLAILYYNQGNTHLAEKYYKEAIENGNMKAINNLAILYDHQGKTDLAEKYFIEAIEKGNIDAIHNLMILYYNQQDKGKLLKVINAQGEREWYNSNFEKYLIFLLYLGQMEAFQENYLQLFEDKNNQLFSSEFLTELLIHHQNQLVWEYFQTHEMAKEAYKPLYYVLISLLGQKEIIKMPPELGEIMNDILDSIKAQQKKFYPHLAQE